MLSVILIALIVVFFFLFVKSKKNDELFIFPAVVGTIFVVVFVAECVLTTIIVTRPAILDQKIEIIEEENVKIENDISTIVESYIDHESKTYADIVSGDKDAIAVALALPELASNELIRSRINLHMDNEREIKNLKRERINLKTYEWLVYFKQPSS